MFEDFFENNAPAGEENLAAERREQIRAAVMTRISRESEEKKMKHIHLRPLIIAAAVISVSTLSLATAYAAAGGTAYDTIIKSGDVTIYHNDEWQEIKENPSDGGDSSDPPDASDITIIRISHKADDEWIVIKETSSDSGDSGNPLDASDITIIYKADDEWYKIKETPSESGLYYRLDEEDIPDEIINSMKQEIERAIDETSSSMKQENERAIDETVNSIQEIERDIYIRLDDKDIPDETK